MRYLMLAGAIAMVAATTFVWRIALGDDRPDPFVHDPPATELATCASGCGGIDKHPKPHLEDAGYDDLLARYAAEPMDETSPALEALLYHHVHVRDYLAAGRTGDLDPARLAFLSRELERTHVWIEIRLVDEDGIVRQRLAPTLVPLEEKQHLLASESVSLQPASYNGTVKRIGLHHLWTRM